MRRPNFALASALALGIVLALAACDAARPVAKAGGGGNACTNCHGDRERPEREALLQAAPATGAHLAHLREGAFREAVSCAECHAVPTSTGHTDGTIQLPFPSLARADGVTPAWDRAAGTCAVYCHGVTLAGGPAASPSWSSGASLGCASCHGYPPPTHAPTSTRCGACHEGTVDGNGELLLSNGLHINGTVDAFEAHGPGWANPTSHGYAAKRDLARCRACHGEDYGGGNVGVSCNACHGGTAWQTSCTFCHGEPGRAANAAAPPTGTQGETDSTARAVGAHQKHLSGGDLGPALACTECHAVPTGLDHVNGTAAVTFGPAARRGLAQPTWNGTSCSGVYCHGATLGAGGANTAPAWTNGDGEAACGACHAAPPPPPHTTSTACGTCHDGYSQGAVNAALHLNGTLDVTGHPAGWSNPTQHGYAVNRGGLASCKSCHGGDLTGGGGAPSCNSCHGGDAWRSTCTFCHGTPGGRASPPVDTQGRSAATNVSVGVHASHTGTAITTPLACVQCHPDRTGSNVVTDANHVDGDGQAEVSFGALARTGGAAATYTRTSATAASCASTYCHGRFPGGANGGQGVTMSWTSTQQVSCSSCHGNSPGTGEHGKHDEVSCSACHGHTGSGATHVNGVKNVPFPGIGAAYDPATRSCGTFSCHGESHSPSDNRW